MASAAKPALADPTTLPKIANPAPLGLAAFGVTTVVLSCINAPSYRRRLPPLWFRSPSLLAASRSSSQASSSTPTAILSEPSPSPPMAHFGAGFLSSFGRWALAGSNLHPRRALPLRS